MKLCGQRLIGDNDGSCSDHLWTTTTTTFVHSLSTLLYVCMTCKAPPLLCRKRQANRILYSMKDGSSVSATESLSPGFIASNVLYIEKSVLHFQNMTRRKKHRRSSDYFESIQEQHPFFPGISS